MVKVTRRSTFGVVAGAGLVSLFGARARANLIDPKSLPEQIMYCTTQIIGRVGQGVKSGTGFFYQFPLKDKVGIPALITNNHVIADTTELSTLLHTTLKEGGPPDGNGPLPLPPATAGAWVAHPDPKVDLCALPVGGVLNSKSPIPFVRTLSTDIIPSQQQLNDLDAIEDVIMVGYPIGLSDTTNNYPIMRRGVTATHPATDFDGRSETVVDIACFPGSSGSPVFIYNDGMYTNKTGGTLVGRRLLFLGVAYAAPIYQPDGTIELKEVPTTLQAKSTLSIPVNLALVIKAKELERLGEALFAHYGIKRS